MVAFRSASEEISQYFKQGVEIPQFFFPVLRYNISKLLLTVFHRVNSIHPVQDALFLLVFFFFFLWAPSGLFFFFFFYKPVSDLKKVKGLH